MMKEKLKADAFETLIVIFGTVCILAALVSTTPKIPLRSTQEWIEHEQDLAHYDRVRADQADARAARGGANATR